MRIMICHTALTTFHLMERIPPSPGIETSERGVGVQVGLASGRAGRVAERGLAGQGQDLEAGGDGEGEGGEDGGHAEGQRETGGRSEDQGMKGKLLDLNGHRQLKSIR